MMFKGKGFVAHDISPAERAVALAAFDARTAARPLKPPSRVISEAEHSDAARNEAAKDARRCGESLAMCSPKMQCRPERQKDL